MKITIMGCGRLGALLAGMLDASGHAVTVLDIDALAFRRLPPTFSGTALIGSGTDEETLKRSGIAETEIFVAVTQGDNRNILAVQIAKHVFNVPRVLCRIYDPLRQEVYDSLGIESFSPTTIFAHLLKDRIESRER